MLGGILGREKKMETVSTIQPFSLIWGGNTRTDMFETSQPWKKPNVTQPLEASGVQTCRSGTIHAARHTERWIKVRWIGWSRELWAVYV